MKVPGQVLSAAEMDRLIEMAWEDRTPFEAIETQYGLNEPGVIALMRAELSAGGFRRWRKRMAGKKTKHRQLRNKSVIRFACSLQRTISMNKISKR